MDRLPSMIPSLDGIPSLGLLAAEDALRLELPNAGSRAEARAILERADLDLGLAEAEVADLAVADPDLRAELDARVRAAREALARHMAVMDLTELWEEFGSCEIVHWTMHDHAAAEAPTILYLGDPEPRRPGRRYLSRIVMGMGDRLRMTPHYSSLPTAPGFLSSPLHAPADPVPGWSGAERSWDGVCVVVDICSSTHRGETVGALDRQLPRIRRIAQSRCLVLDDDYDANVNRAVLRVRGHYQACTANLDDETLSNVAEQAFLWVPHGH